MRTIVHLSDLHFGRIDPVLVTAVETAVHGLAPDALIVSGDFTQRARRSQFAEARRFLDRLPYPMLVVPGNHDVPLWNVLARFVYPLRNYRRYISTELCPVLRDDEMVIVGINTARSLTWKGGRINRRQAEHVRAQLCGIPETVTKMVVTHHPFDLAEIHTQNQLVGRAGMAMRILAECGADVLLAGHFHHAYTGGTAKRYRIEGYSALVVQAGTATSTRLRGSPNSFNVLRLEHPKIGVEVLNWDPAGRQFQVAESKEYERRPGTGFVKLELEKAG